MNKVNLIGRLVKDPEIQDFQNNKICNITLAVERRYSKDDSVDFIQCQAWDKTGELIKEYAKKGHRVAISGRINVQQYEDKEKNKRTSVRVVIEEFQIVDKIEKNKEETITQEKTEQNSVEIIDKPNIEIDEESLPW